MPRTDSNRGSSLDGAEHTGSGESRTPLREDSRPTIRPKTRVAIEGLLWCAGCHRAVDRGWDHDEGCWVGVLDGTRRAKDYLDNILEGRCADSISILTMIRMARTELDGQRSL